MEKLKKLTILHSNDMHGDFTPIDINGEITGGAALLSGYINKVRSEEKNVIYTIAGDMFRGSLIDSEYKGISTIEIMNMLSPDVVALGNHEVDYGIAHLLFLEKCAGFPIINANMILKQNQTRLFNSHKIIEKDGMKILFIAALTELTLAQTKLDKLIGSFIDIKDPLGEIGKVCKEHQDENIDFTVLLTHIGIEEDKRLAEEIDPSWGIDVIIGGHSHTVLEKPVFSAGIPIVQAGYGTTQVGRMDIVIDTEKNTIRDFRWQLVPINGETCEKNEKLGRLILKYKEETDEKYDRVITHFAEKYTHPARNRDTMLGRVLADTYKEILNLDIMLVGSGSIRGFELGPVVRYRDLLRVMPYNDEIYRIFVTGKQLKQIIHHILRPEAFTEHTEFYQFSEGVCVEYDVEKFEILNITYEGKPVDEIPKLKVGIQAFHLSNIKEFLGIDETEISHIIPPKVIATCSTDILEEYFISHDLIKASQKERIKFI